MKKWLFAVVIVAAGYFGIAFEKGNTWNDGGAQVLLVDHGYHTGLVFERASLENSGPNMLALLLQFPQADWFEFGWGETGFYQGAVSVSDISLGQGVEALLTPTESVMHVATGAGAADLVYAPANPVVLRVSDDALAGMLAHISEGFASMVPQGPGIYAISRFYTGTGSYHLFQTCNNWTSQVLRAGGFGASPLLASLSAPLVWEIQFRYGVK